MIELAEIFDEQRQYWECGFQNHRLQSLLSVFIGHTERISICDKSERLY